ncbi:TonB-dependent receptor [Polaribacter litorisediminis]|uniref:TonB-dependent receptor plug domain-containing protein n=1 Tax=Polaribacter litorisediminis TaxID=1908341 RepID=UPI001CBD7671|nr:TonB-dependent receptor [Polaribacter litorisediminis]UAM99469.1 TonB-dependent receptor [Polaribacter litorisediminis]
MNLKGLFIFVLPIIFAGSLYSQKDAVVINLNAFSISIAKVNDFSKGYHTILISDSLVARNIRSLTDILKFNSFIYFKENGLGMVSSPSFRGTSASHTAVIWNGININSQLNGQIDFNAISANSYDNISVRSGGGSVLFGSGAIGGTIHLDNLIQFSEQESHKIVANYGSFNTQHISYDYMKATDKSFINIGLGTNSSDNDFNYLDSNLTNGNGNYFNYNFDANYGYKFNKKHQFKFYSSTFFADRNLSRTLNAPSNDGYEDLNSKNLIEWNFFLSPKEHITSRVSYIFEKFKFFDNNQNKDIFSEGNTERKIAQIDYNNSVSRKLKINGILGFEAVSAYGSSFDSNTRNIFSGVFSLNHQLTKKLSYGIQFRKDFQNDFESPFLYSLGIEQKLNKNYTLSFNTSKNFRIPTFNDLYWQPGGNINLQPEDSYQFEIGNAISFKNISFQVNGFYIKSSELIQWIPNEYDVWSPTNTDETRNIGLEFSANYKTAFKNNILEINANYSYTDAKDLETDQQLISVPKNRFNALFNYQHKSWSAFYQILFNDDVRFLVDTISAFQVSNVGINYELSRLKNKPNIGFVIHNIYNKKYQNTLNRPMPGINFQITTTINF